MTFITESRLRRSFQQFQRKAQHKDWIPARTGKINPNTGLLLSNPRVGLDANHIWVRKHAKNALDTGRGHAAVWNTTFAANSRGVFLITNGRTATGTGDVAFIQVVAPSGSVEYRRCALVDNNTLFVFGTNDAIGYSESPASGVEDKTGDLSVGSEIIGITGY